MPDLQQDMRKFVIDNFLFGEDNGKLANDDSLMEQGLIDSTGALELVTYLEGTYGIKIKDEELDPENLDSINKLVSFITRKTQLSVTEGNGKK